MTAETLVSGSPPGEIESRQFVTFFLDDGQFGVPLSDVQEIIRLPDLVKVPLAPSALLGLANLRGTVLPVASLRGAFDLDDRAADDSMRVVVVDRGFKMGVLVDRMSSVLTAEAGDIDSAEHLSEVTRSDLVEKVVKHPSGRVMVFDPIRVLEGVFEGVAASNDEGGYRGDSGLDRRGETAEAIIDEEQMVSFEVGAQEYAFSIERVKEIVTLPPEVTGVPNTPSSIVGIMVLRDQVLPLVSMRSLLGLPAVEEEVQQRVVVTTGFAHNPTLVVGVVVDTVREVLRVPREGIDSIPPLLQSAQGELTAVCRLDGGRRIVTVVDVEALLDNEALREEVEELGGTTGDMETVNDTVAISTTGEVEQQLVIFRLREEEYGIPVESVQEIVRVPEQMTVVPRAPGFVEGVINLRGEVLPVIDQRRRFSLESVERNDRQRIVVVRVRGQLLGFIVDSVAEVAKIPMAVIGPAPALSEAQAKVIQRVANMEGRGIILLLEPDEMVSSLEGEAIMALSDS